MNQEQNFNKIEDVKNERLEKVISEKNKEIAGALGDNELKDFVTKIPDSFMFEEMIRRNNLKNKTIMSIQNAIKDLEENL